MFGACAECGSEAYLTGLLCRVCAVQLGYVEPECDTCGLPDWWVDNDCTECGSVPRCDTCGTLSELASSWCGDCGCCVQHCQGFVDCLTTTVKGSV